MLTFIARGWVLLVIYGSIACGSHADGVSGIGEEGTQTTPPAPRDPCPQVGTMCAATGTSAGGTGAVTGGTGVSMGGSGAITGGMGMPIAGTDMSTGSAEMIIGGTGAATGGTGGAAGGAAGAATGGAGGAGVSGCTAPDTCQMPPIGNPFCGTGIIPASCTTAGEPCGISGGACTNTMILGLVCIKPC